MGKVNRHGISILGTHKAKALKRAIEKAKESNCSVKVVTTIHSDYKEYSLPKRIRLFIKQDGKCFYCGCETTLSTAIIRDNTATVEHIYSRLHPLRKHGTEIVMACYKCNQEKNREDQLKFRGKVCG